MKMGKHTRKIKWGIVAALCLAAWLVLEQARDGGYAHAWASVMFKGLSGGFVGWLVSRYVLDLDVSSLPHDQRPIAALSQALLIVGFAIAVAVGI